MHHLAYVRRLAPIKPRSPLAAAEIGTEYHADLEAGYNGLAAFQHLGEHRYVLSAEAEMDGNEDLAKAHEKVAAMVSGYAEWLEETGADQDLSHPRPEQTARREFEGLVFQGKIDLLYTSRTWGTLEFMDHKSTGYALSQKMRELKRDTQPVHYAWLLAPVVHLSYATINLARQSLRSSTSVGPYYMRERIEIPPEALEGYERNLRRDWIPALLQAYERPAEDVPAPSPGPDCSWRCPFYDVCPAFDNGEDAEYTLATEYQEHDPLERYREEDA